MSDSEQILANLAQFRASLDEYPERLARARTALAESQEQHKRVETRIADRKAEVTLLVVGELKPGTDKPMFTNESSRQAEVKFRLSQDGQYQADLKESAQLSNDVLKDQIGVNRVEDERRAAEYRLNVILKEADVLITRAETRTRIDAATMNLEAVRMAKNVQKPLSR